jgi:DNA-binding NarL/FixJ family response regulator
MIRVEKPLRANMKRILLVEDNAFFREFLKETMHFRLPSVDILEAANGEEAIKKIETLSPDAVFMDLRLPGENGLELTRKIKAQHPSMIVVILTNYDLPEYRDAAYQSGADHFVSKDSFMDMISSILTNQDISKGNSNSDQAFESPGLAPRLNRLETASPDNRKNE